MNFLDIVLGLPLLWGLWKGFGNGLLIELTSILALIIGIYGAIHFSYIAGNYFTDHMELDGKYVDIAALILTFILIVVAVHILGKVLTKLVNFAMMGLLNKVAGAIFGLIKVAVILGVILIFVERIGGYFDFNNDVTRAASALYFPLLEFGNLIFDRIFQGDPPG